MTKKTVLLIVAIIAFVAVIVVGVTFAWLVHFRNSMIVVSGDANISVEGWCGSVSNLDERAVLFADPESKMVVGKSTSFGEENVDDKPLAASQFITYKFKITNHGARPALLSMRISNMFNYIFDGLLDFVADAEDKAGRGEKVTAPDFGELPRQNNGRLAFLLNYVYYEIEDTKTGVIKSPDGEVMTADSEIKFLNDINNSDMYIWKYSRDQLIIGNDGKVDNYDLKHQRLKKILLPAVNSNGDAPYSINLYFSLTNKQGATTNDEYKKWFTGEEVEGVFTPGAAQNYVANRLYGKSWVALGASTKEYINMYVNEFVDEELKSIMTDEAVMLNLNLKYFEFIGENASDDDIANLNKEPDEETGTEPEPEPAPEP